MTENEAIKELKDYRACCGTTHPTEIEVAIKALEEIQAYRAIGLTPKMIKDMIESEKKACHDALVKGAALKQYHDIGTVEECRVAVERMKPKQPIEYEDKYYGCPNCDNPILHKWEKYPTLLTPKSKGLSYCLNCGQAIDWSEKGGADNV